MGCCSQRCRQFMLLVWKNFKLQIRRPIGTAFELIIPPLAVLFVIGLRFGIPRFRAEDRCFATFDSDTLTVSSMQNYTLFYAPRNQTPDYLVHLIRSKLPNSHNGGHLVGMDTEEDIIAMIDSIGRENLQPFPGGRTGCFIGGAGIVFDNLEGNAIEYTLRLRHEVGRRNTWFTGRAAATFQLAGPRISNFYLSEGFLHLENIVGLSIVEWKSGKSLNVTTAVRQLPQPPYSRDLFLSVISFVLPFLLLLAFLYSAGVFVKELVLEKETRIRESMLMMGLSQWVLWSTWYLKQFIFLFISVIIMAVLLKFGRVFPASDFLLLLIFFTLFILSMISFGYLVSVWFNSARVGLLVGFLAWFINYLPFLFLATRYDDLSLGAKVGVCFLSNTCVGLGVEVLSRLELRQEGLRWGNAALPLSAEDSFNMAWVFGMLVVDSILYMVLAWYVNGVKPGEYGVPKPFYFPCLPSYWTGNARKQTTKESLIHNDTQGYDPSAHEEEPPDLKAGIRIRSLTKVYNQSFLSRFFKGSRRHRQEQRKVAVDDLNLNMYKGQITALLGHNGAGKTTTMSILTGLYTPTSGTALVNGYDILGNMDKIRENLGICPQHNVLFDRLTVAEHLSFFTRLKGVWGTDRVNEEVGAMMADLQLLDKRNIPASKLSGGMKRKLSVGIALIGGSEVVVLDEPTSGMDPYARRATWDLLVKYKQGRTVLLTTHHMDEADLLGDRIAILAEGKLRCSGSSLFLKSRYGVGYHMTLVKEPKCDSSQVGVIVQSIVHKAEQVTDVGAELSFVLPSSATPHFPQLFDMLESRKAELGISSFGVSVTTMEEVFMKVGEGTEETLETRVIRSASPQVTSRVHSPAHHSAGLVALVTIEDLESTNTEVQEAILNFRDEDSTPLPGQVGRPSIIDIAETVIGPNNSASMDKDSRRLMDGRPHYLYTPNRGITLWVQQFWAMFLKRFYNSVRFFGALFSQFLLPMLFVLFALVLAVTIPGPNQDDPRRALLLENSALSDNITVFYVEFGNEVNSPLNFSSVDASALGVTEFLDYTGGVRAVIDETLSDLPNSTRQCCKYRYQILDQYCATREGEDLAEQCGSSVNFGFNTCRQCLSCCTSRQAQLPSCSNPLYQLLPASDASQFCPAAPQVAFSRMAGGNPSGELDSSNVYIAERLLSVSEEVQQAVFYQRFQAGFAVTRRDPPYSVCSCSLASDTCSYISPLQQGSGEECYSQYSIQPRCNLAWAACIGVGNCLGVTPTQCQDFDPPSVSSPGSTSRSSSGSGGGAGSDGGGAGVFCSVPLPGCYVVDGFSANVMNNASCSNPTGLAPTCTAGSQHATYPDQAEEVAVTVWYNNQPYHMSAAALNAFHSLLLKQVTGNHFLSIIAYNHPLPRNITAQADTTTRNNVGFAIGSLVVFGYSFLLASFVLFLVTEKETKAKHLQFVSGVHTTSYWLANLTWDLLNGAVPIIISFILFAAFQVEAYSGEGLAAVLLLFIFTTWSSIPLTYCFSFLFSNSLAAYGLLMIFFFFVALLTQVVVLLVDADVADIIHYIFLVFPTYGLAIGFSDIYINQISKDICTASVQAMRFCELPSSPIRYVDNVLSFERPGIGVIITYMAVEGLLFFILTLLIERSWFFPEVKQLFIREENFRNGDTGPLLPGEDSDVSAERKRVTSGATAEDEVIVIKNLAKEYSSSIDGCSIRPSKLAVGGISVAIPSAECFGLLGVNGAGKTTTFSILTGDITMSSGTAVIAGYDIRTHLRDVQQRIGYCPQFDALIERLTGRELLTMFARLRGIPEVQIKEVVETEITRLDLSVHADKRCGRYSGGNKRKLSTAIALVGNPPIVLLDEPTTGMDPTTRRYLWDVLTGITQEGRSIVLTSHSMEECEALCTRLAIMVNGCFKCLGSIQHLKNKYGAGYTLQVKVKLTAPPEPLTDLHRSSFRNISLRRNRSNHGSRSQTPSYGVQNPSFAHESIGLKDVSMQRSHSPGTISDTTSLHTFIRETFPGALLLEEHQGAVTYQLPSANTTWSTVFRQLENNKGRLNIIDYSVSQTTLEQVFINFAKEQEDSDA